MPEPETVETIRAAVDTIAPATAELPGALALGVERHVLDLVEMTLPGLADMIAALLDAYAAEAGGARFADLDVAGRSAVLRAMSADESQDIRDAVDALLVFTMGGTFSEWTGYDRASGALKPPKSWAVAGFHGPVHGHPDYREDA